MALDDQRNPVGRPRLYDDPLELATECEKYFAECEEKKERPMITGLCLYLGFADKTTLYDYRDRPEYSHPVKRAIMRVEMAYESRLDSQAVAGSIFALKNMGWKDKTEQDLNIAGEPIRIIMPPNES